MPCKNAVAGAEWQRCASAAATRRLWRSSSFRRAREHLKRQLRERCMKMAEVRAVVTGGASGLGHAVASHLIAQGGRVALLDVQQAAGAKAAEELGEHAHYFNCDVTAEAAVNEAMAAARSALGSLNLLVNCAGITGSARVLGKAGPMPGEQYEKVIRINL